MVINCLCMTDQRWWADLEPDAKMSVQWWPVGESFQHKSRGGHNAGGRAISISRRIARMARRISFLRGTCMLMSGTPAPPSLLPSFAPFVQLRRSDMSCPCRIRGHMWLEVVSKTVADGISPAGVPGLVDRAWISVRSAGWHPGGASKRPPDPAQVAMVHKCGGEMSGKPLRTVPPVG